MVSLPSNKQHAITCCSASSLFGISCRPEPSTPRERSELKPARRESVAVSGIRWSEIHFEDCIGINYRFALLAKTLFTPIQNPIRRKVSRGSYGRFLSGLKRCGVCLLKNSYSVIPSIASNPSPFRAPNSKQSSSTTGACSLPIFRDRSRPGVIWAFSIRRHFSDAPMGWWHC